MKKALTIAILVLTFGTVGFVWAAPTVTFERSILPQATNVYDLGSSTDSLIWNRLFANYVSSTAISAPTVCINGDCQSEFPNSGAFTWTTNFGTIYAATSSPFWAQNNLAVSSTLYLGEVGGQLTMTSSSISTESTDDFTIEVTGNDSALNLYALGTGGEIVFDTAGDTLGPS